MRNFKLFIPHRSNGNSHEGEKGVAVLELALILPVLLLITFAIIDFGRLFQARLILTNLAREGGSIASRDIKSPADLVAMLQAGATPLDLASSGRIYIWKIRAGESADEPYPYIDDSKSASSGSLSKESSIGNGKTRLGLSSDLYNHLVFETGNATADISEITVVEVFYDFDPVTPITEIADTFWNTRLMENMILSSKAVF